MSHLDPGAAPVPVQRELLGMELRDVFDAHPSRPLAPGEAPALDNMIIFTDKVCPPCCRRLGFLGLTTPRGSLPYEYCGACSGCMGAMWWPWGPCGHHVGAMWAMRET